MTSASGSAADRPSVAASAKTAGASSDPSGGTADAHARLPQPPRFCPRCGHAIEDASRPLRCATPGCGYAWYPDPKVGTGVVAADAQGRMLLVRRNHEPRMGAWAFPSGFVDAGEVVEEAAVREVREETGVDVRLDALLGVYSEPGEPVVFIAYAGTIVAGTPAAGDEAFEVGLFAPDALPPLAFEHDASIVAAWRAHRDGRAPRRPPAGRAPRAGRAD